MAYLLDTNHLGAALNRVSPLRERILQAKMCGARFATCWPMLCELEAGIVSTKHAARNRQTLVDLLKKIAIWPRDWQVVRQYGVLAQRLAERGRALSSVDITLAALAIESNAIVLTTDRDFEGLPEIRVENWCADAA